MRAMTKEKKIYQQAENVSISYALPRKSIKRSDLGLNKTNIVSFAKIVMKTTTITFTASSANRFTPTTVKTKMMISGLAVTIVNAG